MYKAAISFFAIILLHTAAADSAVEARTGTLQLSGTTNNNNLINNLVYIVPLLIIILILDFAIFGTFAQRSDNLNPVSDFFWHAKRGLQIWRQRRRNSQYYPPSDLARPAPGRVARCDNQPHNKRQKL